MKQILKYLIFLMIGIIICILVNRKDRFSIGVPFNIDDEVRYIGPNHYFIMSNGATISNPPPGLTMGEYITSETRGMVLGLGPPSIFGTTYIVRFYTGVGGDLKAELVILEDELELYPNIRPIPLPGVLCASQSQP